MTNPVLALREEFIKALANYQPSDDAKKLIEETDVVLLRGPSGAGRNTIIAKLEQTGKYKDYVTDTTRPPRMENGSMEQNGVEYWFRSEPEMLQDIKTGQYVEAELIHNQQVSGMSIRELRDANDHHMIAIADVHFGGVNSVRNVKPDTFVIFIVPPSYKEWLRRFTTRGEINQDEFRNRFKTSEEDFEHAFQTKGVIFVLNEDVDLAAARIRKIVETKNYIDAEHEEAKNTAWEIMNEIKQELNS